MVTMGRTGLAAAALLVTAVGAAPVGLKPAGAGYAVRMPAKPDHKRQVARQPLGTAEVNVYMAEAGGLIFLASDTAYPSRFVKRDGAAKVLRADRDGFVRSLKGKVTREKAIMLGQHPGREFDVATPGGQEFRTRQFLVGFRMYQLSFGGPKGSLKEAEGARFLASFRLVK